MRTQEISYSIKGTNRTEVITISTNSMDRDAIKLAIAGMLGLTPNQILIYIRGAWQ